MINKDAAIVTDATEHDLADGGFAAATAALLKLQGHTDAETLSDAEEEDETDDEDEAEADDESYGNETDDDENEVDDEAGESEAEDEDEREFSHVVDGKEMKFKLKYAKALVGRETAINAKEVAIAEQRKAVQTDIETLEIVAEHFSAKTAKRLEPFEKINWLVDPQKYGWTPDETEYYLKQANEALEEQKFYDGELKKLQEMRAAEKQKKFKADEQDFNNRTTETFTRIAKERPGIDLKKWYATLQNHIVNERGISPQQFAMINDREALLIMEDAMLYRSGKTAETKKVNKAPKNVVKSTRNPEAQRTISKSKVENDAFKRLRQTGDPKDALAYYMNSRKK